ncbi:phosphatidylserine decarboxylase [Deinococcus koreensis]|uniref:Phosphatidylserine decarboxylase n=1 Tax=Deinococcus koreensis TaxID=2054903 RepID=A0A2K3UYU4_9DEIO|nr:phosphatidylserine decarboxylase [Deinococcus koreensis]PNY81704.1 hypothetical protein CVO96_10245 [Deinococcus koreensis]
MRLFRLLPLAAAGLLTWYVRKVHRFRDPVRVVGAGADAGGDRGADTVLSPADGLVSFVRRVSNGQIQAGLSGTPLRLRDVLGAPGADGWLLGILVGPLDVHYTYQPVGGKITAVTHRGSRADVPLLSLPALLGVLTGRVPELLETRGALENERLSVSTQTGQGDVTVTLVGPGSGLNALPFLREGDQGRVAHKLAFVPEGALVLLHLPEALVPLVSVGDRVVGTQTVIAQTVTAQG